MKNIVLLLNEDICSLTKAKKNFRQVQLNLQ